MVQGRRVRGACVVREWRSGADLQAADLVSERRLRVLYLADDPAQRQAVLAPHVVHHHLRRLVRRVVRLDHLGIGAALALVLGLSGGAEVALVLLAALGQALEVARDDELRYLALRGAARRVRVASQVRHQEARQYTASG